MDQDSESQDESRLPPRKPRLLDQVRETLRGRHYSRRTEKTYIFWIRRYIHFTGKRIATGSLIDPATRTVQTLFEIDNKDRRVRVGSLVNVVITTGAPVESVVVPSSALLDRNGTPVVIVKTAPESFEVRSVAVGPKAGGSTGIQAGVRAGERVVVDGAMAVLLAAGG